LKRTTAQMLKSFHDTWYAPNNAILVITGDVQPAAALTLVRQLFAEIPAKKLPAKPAVRLREVQPTTIMVDTDRPSGTLMIATRTPGPRGAGLPAPQDPPDVLDRN